MFYTDKSNGQSKGEILSNQNHIFVLSLRRSRRGAAWAVKKAIETNTVRERRTTLAERLKR